jgi:hypothetical protein
MKCENVQELISSFIDGEIMENIDIAFHTHLNARNARNF